MEQAVGRRYGRRCGGRYTVLTVFGLWAAIVAWPAALGAPQAPAPRKTPAHVVPAVVHPSVQRDLNQYRPVLDKYCVTCHNERRKAGSLALDTADLSNVPAGGDTWEKVVRKLRAGLMPPQGMPRPDAATVTAFVSALETTLDAAALATPNPGRVLLHRLNRAEYANAIRDILELDVDPATLLPADDSSYGFDNNADVLGVSPALLQSYVSAAGKISALAVGDAAEPSETTYKIPLEVTQREHIEGLPLGTRGGRLITHNFPVDGEYLIKVKLFQTNVGFLRGMQSVHEVELTLDGERTLLAKVGGDHDYRTNIVAPEEVIADVEKRLTTRLHVMAGPRVLTAAFLEKSAVQALNLLQPWDSWTDPVDMDGMPQIDSVVISGPFGPTAPGDTPTRRRIFTCRPAQASEERSCATTILSKLARRAYRRPVAAADLQPVMTFYESGRTNGTFDRGIEMGLRRILASPEFVFRAEREPKELAPGTVFPLSDLELASRLSFFLWSSVPDDRLVTLAAESRLHDPVVLDREVRRMLRDPRADALVSNFAGQWLYLRNLKGVAPDPEQFHGFDDNLRQAFRRETELLFDSVIREDRNVLDLLTADYTFVNERLALHYGIPGVYGSQFRRVAVTDEARKGLLGQGSILTITSHANKTSPVLRGKWILENLLGTPPPPPPPNVPPLNDKNAEGKVLSVRAQMEQHRANPVCATCHKVMDPLGFALENFDAVGAWRTKDAGVPIDPSSQLADGLKVDGPVALRRALLRQPEAFVRTATEKLLTYALGRGLESYDMPAVRRIIRASAGHDYRFSSLVLGVVQSVPFRMRIKPLPATEPPLVTRAGS